jgi:hypothetical protein
MADDRQILGEEPIDSGVVAACPRAAGGPSTD